MQAEGTNAGNTELFLKNIKVFSVGGEEGKKSKEVGN